MYLPDSGRGSLLQIAHFLHSLKPKALEQPKVTLYEKWCTHDLGQRKGISLIYRMLLGTPVQFFYMIGWEMNLTNEWDLEQDPLCSFIGIMNVAQLEANVFSRWYIVPADLAKMYPLSSLLCFRGCNLMGSMFHVQWECLRI